MSRGGGAAARLAALGLLVMVMATGGRLVAAEKVYTTGSLQPGDQVQILPATGIYAKDDIAGSHQPWVHLDTFELTPEEAITAGVTISALLFSEEAVDDAGYWLDRSQPYPSLCCTRDVQDAMMEADMTPCSLGMPVFTPSRYGGKEVFLGTATLSPGDDPVGEATPAPIASTTLALNADVNVTGEYTVFLLHCQAVSSFSYSGYISIQNPFGRLPTSVWRLYPFFGVMALIYLSMGLVWLVLSACHWRVLLGLQHWISLVILLGWIEMVAKYFEYKGWNASGLDPSGAHVFSAMTAVGKRTVSRVLVLLVCLGWGVVKPTLGKTYRAVACMGVTYFVLSLVLDLSGSVSGLMVVVVVAVAVVDTSFYWWSLTAIGQVTKSLKNKAKRRMYNRLFYTLVLSIVLALGLILVTVGIRIFSPSHVLSWKSAWVVDAYWDLLYVFILLVVMALWRPTSNNLRYAYEGLGETGMDDLGDSATRSGMYARVSRRGGGSGSVSITCSDSESSSSGGRLADLRKAFTIDDDGATLGNPASDKRH